ncbi:holo-ACP synthase [Nitratiruptor tergarcus]|uniref:Holo-[acyl-carrier-protein] synthase n=1 Tax=Nitratiruptor tergarcus DSM 16512 TaxID=1069081 RepID=A0A1W1WUH8_9BACT|nr:holo-ACP synthase [Nitratiruptor tergarcus]SMC09839.1 holo-[acyl-carrier protein] synthase [Nitratiruptor tergarcus DSM 16512]
MIGIDIVAIKRIENFIEKHGNKGLERFLLPSEISIAKKPQTVAGFWAAKEAIAKALRCGIGSELSFKDIEIYKELTGAPAFRLLHGKEEKFEIIDSSLSISHDGGFAIAAAFILTASSKS